MNINERLSQLVELKGYTARSFSSQLGVSSQRFSNYLKDRDPDYDTLNRIVETFVDVDPGWLLTGEGEMIKDKYSGGAITRGDQLSISQLTDQLKDKDKIINVLEKHIEVLEEQIADLKKRYARQDGSVSDADATKSAI